MRLDEEICHECPSNVGCTALVALIRDRTIHFANCGDTMAVICNEKGNVVSMSQDHKTEYESERVVETGGFVTYFDGVARVNGALAIARSLGDAHLKKYVISDPYHASFPVSQVRWILMASDGLWDVFTPADIEAEVQKYQSIRGWDAQAQKEFPTMLADKAIYVKRSTDNITIILITVMRGSPGDQSFDLD